MTGPNLSEWALKSRSFIIFLMVGFTAAGLLSFYRLGRGEDPPFTFRTMIVQASWPGATLDDTVKQVTERIERKLQETRGLDFLRSYTTPGLTTIFVTLKGSTTAKEVPDIWYQVRKNIGDIRHTLPQGVVGPGFNDDFGDTFGIIYGFTADGFSHRELRDYVEDVRSKLLHVNDVSKIEIIGAQDEQIFVEFSTQKLAGLGIDRAALIAALQAQNAVSPAGSIQTGDEKLSLRVSGAFRSEDDILNVNFLSNGRLIRLRDIAEVRRGYSDPPQPLFRVDGKPAIGLAIAMRDGGDILALGANIRSELDKAVAELPLGVEPALVSDQPQVVTTAIGEFMESLWQAVAIIMAISVVSLGLRPGAIVALTIPLTIAIVFPIMEFLDIDLQRISLGALIISLSLLVDDAMTTIDAMTTRLALGDDKEKAASFAYKTLAFPMLTGTFVTIAGFVPIGFARSAAGEYTFSIFAVVAIALIVSWFVAVLFAPLLGVWLLKAPPAGAAPEKPNIVLRLFRSVLVGMMRMRWISIAAALGCLVAALIVLPHVPRQFFPASDRPELVVDLTLPQNASIYASEAASAKLDAMLKEDPDVASWSTYVGRGAIRFYLPLNVQLANDFFSQAVVVAKDVAARERLQAKLEKELAEQLPTVVARVSPLELGPPVGWPVQYRVSGPDTGKVREIALKLAEVMGGNATVRDVNFDWMEPARKVRIKIDQDQARLLGLSSQALATSLNAVMTGLPITQVRDDIYLVNVVARATDEQRISLSTLRSMQLPVAGGRTVPLSQVASFDFEQELPLLWRRDRTPTLTVQAETAKGVLPETAVHALAPAIDKLRASLPDQYQITTGGTVEESVASQASVFAMLPVAAILMLFFLMMQLQSFGRMFLVVAIVPFGLIGIVFALFAANRPLGFVAILGILALVGMIARNAVILIDQIETERAQGRDIWNAVIEAALSRFRPIMLTAISTVLGMIPIAPTVFWGPMAFAIMGGLFVATMLTLLVLPVFYITLYGAKETAAAKEPVAA
ncbi:acriflavin resistance protein [Methylocella silvestris BL2]|uniref:Acriflavin resistance protein n=1 Tax=Methylocella silvestris (strain DSM 15510 / CIP 108128 / LMG 27833 / NCIMB 13906 / BL2) TaxID=395965 RepID=B8ELM2_METSB|nr:efflux RND transporter permease subunit [Methylocella silvestris]ACK50016.1 acriflavin resistance protein [Methylocella silvestris BL2]